MLVYITNWNHFSRILDTLNPVDKFEYELLKRKERIECNGSLSIYFSIVDNILIDHHYLIAVNEKFLLADEYLLLKAVNENS